MGTCPSNFDSLKAAEKAAVAGEDEAGLSKGNRSEVVRVECCREFSDSV